jgi:ribonuclease HII
MSLILGIDEAGRGALCGPMVIAGAVMKEKDQKKLKELGVTDSKLLSPSKRERIRKSLEGLVKYAVFEVQPKEIDENNLNHLELDYFAKIIKKFEVDKIFVDAMEKNTEKVKINILKRVGKKVNLIAENKADSKYLIVGAASIIAKTLRDQRIEELKQKYGDFGSGYPSDSKTVKFVKEWIRKNRFIPVFVRKKWSTLDGLKQRKLGEF